MAKTRICPDCKNELDENANICDRCGFIFSPTSDMRFTIPGGPTNVLSSSENFPPPFSSEEQREGIWECSACGYQNIPGEMFCQKCGVQLPPVLSPAPPLPWSSEKTETISEVIPVEHPENPRLVVIGKGNEIRLSFQKTEIMLGRTDPISDIYPDIDLTPYDGDRRGISRKHARIYFVPEGIFIEDLGSTNFTFLNRYRLEPGKRYPLHDGDEIRLGLLVLTYYS